MKIGDIEYTRRETLEQTVANTSVSLDINYATGIRLRPLLVRAQAWLQSASAVTTSAAVYLENGQSVGAGLAAATLQDDDRLFPLHWADFALATNGMGMAVGMETRWWKILLPQVRLHVAGSVLANVSYIVTLHYRFAELTPEEIIEIAAQRAQE